MQQLAGSDSYWLHAEKGNTYNHVASLGIFDPSTSPNGMVRFKEILGYFERRLHLSPVFRRRLANVPHGLDRPYWIEDSNLDLEFHIRHIALPEPGDWRQLMIQVARLHSRPLDRSHPLWEAYVIEGLHRIPGLPPGSFAIFMKFHHSSIDGQAGVELLSAIHSLSPEPDPDGPVQAVPGGERDPTAIELYSRAAVHTLERTLGAGAWYGKTVMKLGGTVLNGLVRQIERDPESVAGRSVWPRFIKAPDTRFNHQISANRVFEAVSLPMGPMKAMRRTIEGSTINDIFLSVLGGALHHYLKSKQELPEKSMTALMPISVRDASQPAVLGNQVGGAPVKMHSEIADPLKRLEAVHIDTTAAKGGSEALGNNLLKDIMDGMPHTVTDQFLRYGVFSQLNATASNLRGPDVPLYVAGARLEQFYPVSIVMDHVGLNHTAFSYNGTMWIGVVACRNMMPDPGFYADCLRRSFSELVEAAEARAGSGGTPVRSPKDSTRRGSKPAPRLKKLARKKKPAKRPAA